MTDAEKIEIILEAIAAACETVIIDKAHEPWWGHVLEFHAGTAVVYMRPLRSVEIARRKRKFKLEQIIDIAATEDMPRGDGILPEGYEHMTAGEIHEWAKREKERAIQQRGMSVAEQEIANIGDAMRRMGTASGRAEEQIAEAVVSYGMGQYMGEEIMSIQQTGTGHLELVTNDGLKHTVPVSTFSNYIETGDYAYTRDGHKIPSGIAPDQIVDKLLADSMRGGQSIGLPNVTTDRRKVLDANGMFVPAIVGKRSQPPQTGDANDGVISIRAAARGVAGVSPTLVVYDELGNPDDGATAAARGAAAGQPAGALSVAASAADQRERARSKRAR